VAYVYGDANSTTNVAGNKFKTDTWQHIVVTYKSSVYVRVYVDGTLEANNTVSIPSTLTGHEAASFMIATDAGGFGGRFKGLIDDVRLYNRALSDTEIKALYGTPQPWSVGPTESAFGARLRSSSTDADAKWGTDGSSDKWLNVGDGDYTVVSRSSPTASGGSLEVLQYRAEIGGNKIQPTGVYQTTVTYTASAL